MNPDLKRESEIALCFVKVFGFFNVFFPEKKES